MDEAALKCTLDKGDHKAQKLVISACMVPGNVESAKLSQEVLNFYVAN